MCNIFYYRIIAQFICSFSCKWQSFIIFPSYKYNYSIKCWTQVHSWSNPILSPTVTSKYVLLENLWLIPQHFVSFLVLKTVFFYFFQSYWCVSDKWNCKTFKVHWNIMMRVSKLFQWWRICLTGDAGDTGLIPGSGRSSGVGNGNPPQCSCLENSTDRGAGGLQFMRVTKSQTWLSTCAHTLWWFDIHIHICCERTPHWVI